MNPILKITYSSQSQKPIVPHDYQRLQNCWPPFVQNSLVAQQYLGLRFSIFSDFFLYGVDSSTQKALCYSTAFPIWIDPAKGVFPRSWDESLQLSSKLYNEGVTPNSLCMLDATVDKEARGQGLAAALIQKQLQNAASHGLQYILIPVRPISSFDENYSSELFLQDPWIQHHIRIGGTSLGLSKKSMTITGTGSQWKSWTNVKLSSSGHYQIDGGVVPLFYDANTDQGTYSEPNLLVLHQTKK